MVAIRQANTDTLDQKRPKLSETPCTWSFFSDIFAPSQLIKVLKNSQEVKHVKDPPSVRKST